MFVPNSAASGIKWPAIPSSRNATMLALQFQLEQTQWWPRETLEQIQLRQLSDLLAHAHKYVPFYRDRLGVLADGGFKLESCAQLQTIPILSRQDVQDSFEALTASALPQDHLPLKQGATSGSTGTPIRFRTTKVTGLFASALRLRSSLWHEVDFLARTASIQYLKAGTETSKQVFKPRASGVFPSRSAIHFDIGKTVGEQLAWLQEADPEMLVTHPSNLAALAGAAHVHNASLPSLKYLSTMGEVVSPEVRAICSEVWGLKVVDIYSCRELNILALQCPETDHYHVQSERVILEVLDEEDRPCGPGETGRVVLTDLHNYAMPFIRYEIGDFAEVGGDCTCGRSLPVLTRILGRTRNMLVLPSGEQLWPHFRVTDLTDLAPIRQLQVIQHTYSEIELRMAVDEPLPPATESRLIAKAEQMFGLLGQGFTFRLSYVEHIPRSKSGKYEDFQSKVAAI